MKLKLAAALAVLPLLAACAPQLSTTVYVRDIDEVVASNKELGVPATLRIPQSSTDSCADALPGLVENLGKLTPIKGAGKCIEDGSDSFAEIDTTISIIPEGVGSDEPRLFAIVVGDGPTDGSHTLSVAMNSSIEDVVEAVDPDANSGNFDPARFNLTVNNDGNGPVSLTPGEVFLDGEARMPGDGPTTLDRRNEVTIVLSDVASRYVVEANSYQFATVATP